jgi:HEAT repeat protein
VLIDERQKDLIFSLAAGKLSEEDFLGKFPLSSREKSSLGPKVLQFALSAKDPDAVEAGTILAAHFGMSEDFVDILEQLAKENWHKDHEDVVFALGKLASPTSVGAIYAAAQSHHPYLEDYDDSFQIRSKSIHALRNVGTAEAVRRLEELLNIFQEPKLQSKIVRRLQELAAEGASEQVRSEARAALSRAGAAGSEDRS